MMRVGVLLLVAMTLAIFSFACNRGTFPADSSADTATGNSTKVAGAQAKQESPAAHGVIPLTESNFESIVLKSDRPVLVDFYADWCAPCRMLAPTLDQLAKEYDGEVIFGKLDTDRYKRLSNDYFVRGLPTLIIFKDGKPAERIIGFQNKKVIRAKIDKVRR